MFIRYKRNKEDTRYGVFYAEGEGAFLDLSEGIVDTGGMCYEYFYIKDGCEFTTDFTVEKLETTDDLISFIKNNSKAYMNLNNRIQDMIRVKYSLTDELKILRTGVGSEEYNNYVNLCIDSFSESKTNMGL